MRTRIIQTTLTQPAKLKYHHPIGTPITIVDKFIEADGKETLFNYPKVDGMYLNRAEDLLRVASIKKQNAFSSRKPINPKNPDFGEAFTDESILDFFELGSAAISLLHAAVEFVANYFIEQAENLIYKKLTYHTLFKVGNINIQIKKEADTSLEEILRFSIHKKLKSVLPLHYHFSDPSKEPFWEGFILLNKLRNQLMHVTRRESYGASRNENSVYAELLRIDLDGLFINTEALIQHIENNCNKTD